MVLAQRLRRLADFALTGQEYQDVAGLGAGSQFIDRVYNGLRQIDFVLVLVFFIERPVQHLNRIEPPRDFDDRRVAKMRRELLRVDRGRSDDQFQIGTSGQKLADIAQQKIDVQTALMRLVDDQRVVARQPAVALGFRQQDSIGHELDVAIRAGLVGEAHLIADGIAQTGAQLGGHPRGHRARGDAPRLGMPDHALHAAAHVETQLGQLRSFARPGFAADDHDLIGLDGGADVGAPRTDRQLLWISHRWQILATLRGTLRRVQGILERLAVLGRDIFSRARGFLDAAQPPAQRAALEQHAALDGFTQRAQAFFNRGEGWRNFGRTHQAMRRNDGAATRFGVSATTTSTVFSDPTP